MFLKECTRDQKIIQELLEQNSDLKKALEARGTAEQMAHPKFLQDLIAQSVKNSSGKLSYTDRMKSVALYLYILSGPQAYEIWRQNLALPSISTVRRKLGKEEPVQEGDIRVDAAKGFLIRQDEPLFVFIAEDDTKTTPGVNYNVIDDTVIGLELPLDKNGVPIQSYFKFTSISAVQEWSEDSIPINIARLTPLAETDELRFEESFPAEETDDVVLDVDDEEDLGEISRDQAFMCNLNYVTNDGRRDGALQEDLSNIECPRGFLAFKRNNEPLYLRKSSLLWMLTSKNSKVSADRLHRFINEKKVQGDDHVMCGDFVMMESDDNGPDRLCQVLGFKFLTGNPKFSAMSCPIKVEEEKARGVAVFCAFFRVTNDVVTAMRSAPKYIDMKKFKNHVTIGRDLHSDKISLS